jgi:RTX calcium-binding nonapeptide repeat (4 copies)
MRAWMQVPSTGRRAVAVAALAGGFLAASLGLAASEADAAPTAQVQSGTLRITGDAGNDILVLRLQQGAPDTLQVDVGADGSADFSFDRNSFTQIDVVAGPAADDVIIDESGGSFTDETIRIDGGTGSDLLRGGSGAETIVGRAGHDVVDPGRGDDVAQLGAGDDLVWWNPRDGSDMVEGQEGLDSLEVTGNREAENIDVAANGSRVRLTRDIANVVMDLDDVERLALRARGGADSITVNDLTGTGLANVDIDLFAPMGGGDLQADTITALGTDAADLVTVNSTSREVVTNGLPAQLRIAGSEQVRDQLHISTLGGDDLVQVALAVRALIRTSADLGADE